MKTLSYSHIDLKSPTRVFNGRARVTECDAVAGVTITRYIDPPLDYAVVEGGTARKGIEIEWSNVAAGERIPDMPALKGKGGRSRAVEDPE